MDLQIKTKSIRLTDGLEEYIHKRVERLERVNETVVDAKFELRSVKNRTGGEHTVAQLTIATKHCILRAEEKNLDPHTAIDLAVDHMERQIRRFHDKKVLERRRQRVPAAVDLESTLLTETAAAPGEERSVEEEAPVEEVVRRKRFKMQPMSADEAIEHMELLGHDFFVFFNHDDAQVNVLYRRKDGQYGVIQPDLA